MSGIISSDTLVGFNVDKFRGYLNNVQGVLKPSKFMIYLTPPAAMAQGPMSSFATEGAKGVQFACSAAMLPGMEAITFDARRYGYGAIQKLPWAPGFGPCPMQLITDGSGLQWSFFRAWMSKLVSFDMSRGINGPNPAGYYPYEVGYLTDYAVDVSVIQFNDNGQEILEVTLRNAYPIGMGEIKLDWGENNAGRFNVFFHFQDWKQVDLEVQEEHGLSAEQD